MDDIRRQIMYCFVFMAANWLFLLAAGVIFVWLRPWRSTRRLTLIATRIFLMLWTFATILQVLETSFVLFFNTTDSFAQSNICRLWFLRHTSQNAQECRDAKEFTREPPPHVRRIALLGDSFTWGHGIANIEDRFGDILQRRWNESEPAKIEVYNYSQCGISTPDYISQLEVFSKTDVHNDLIVLVYCLNDIETKSIPAPVVTVLNSPSENFFVRTTFLPNFLYLRLKALSIPEVRDYFHWAADAYTGDSWVAQQKLFDQVREMCREQHANLLVVTFPFMHNIGPDYPFAEAHRVLAEYWNGHGVPYLDLLETLRPHAVEGLTVSYIDAHPNEHANQLAADAIRNFIREHQTELLPKLAAP